MFEISDAQEAYDSKVSFHCKTMLCTDADGDIRLITPTCNKTFAVKKIDTVSTIGAGDNFNAGVVYALMSNRVRKDDIAELDEATWTKIVNMGQTLAANVCQSLHNSISKEFANEISSR